MGLCYVCVSCESGLSMFLADTCASEVHPVFNHVAPYRYMFPNMYWFIADITNPDSFV